jgi:hypothetical protein
MIGTFVRADDPVAYFASLRIIVATLCARCVCVGSTGLAHRPHGDPARRLIVDGRLSRSGFQVR